MLELLNLRIDRALFSLTADLKFPQGCITALIGPSGCGKSTILSAISGFLPIAKGQIFSDGRLIGELSPIQRDVGIVFQDHNLFPRLTIRENIRLGRQNASEVEIESCAEKFGIADLLKRYPRQVSGGQAARAALSRLVLQSPKLWLLDEPFSALGPKLERTLRKRLFEEFSKDSRRTCIFVSHQPETIREWADYVVWVDEGIAFEPIKSDDFFQKKPFSSQNYL